MNADINIWHTANAGVLIKIGRNCIGVDVFSKDPNGLYPDTPKAVKEKLLEEIEKGNIGALLFTHAHGDHFCLEDAAEALERNPKLTIISTEEVVELIREVKISKGQLYGISPKERRNVKINFLGGILELFNSRHMGETYAGVQNLTCMLEAEGVRIVIPGDAWPEPELFARIAVWCPEPELLIAPFPLVGIPSNRKSIVKYLKPSNILAFHLPRPEMDRQNWLASAKKICERAADDLPMPIFGETLGKEYQIL